MSPWTEKITTALDFCGDRDDNESMSNNNAATVNADRYAADFCFSADVLSAIDAVDICECFGLAPVVADDDSVAAALAEMAASSCFVDDDGDVFASVVTAATVASRKR